MEKAVRDAVDECISEGVLADFFRRHREEIIEMGIFEFDQELHDKILKEDAWEEGRKEGMIQINRLHKYLCDDGRTDDLMHSMQDSEFQEKLLKEYGLLTVDER